MYDTINASSIKKSKTISLLLLLILIITNCLYGQKLTASKDQSTEIFYHVFQRSFYDSNGDLHGDLKGLEQKLDYLQELGVTSILLLPLYESEYYHNYFPTDFKAIDPEYGTEADYLNLVREVHRRSMKIYMDMEIHYVAEDHIWYKDSYQNPSSDYSDYIIYNGPNNTEPETIIFNLTQLEGYDGKIRKMATLNLHNKAVKRQLYDLFIYWADPNQDGNFSDGVDGFRIDHMMDDLDWKGKVTGMLTKFWKPLFAELRSINPEIKIVGEQANWFSYGGEYFTEAGLDYLFAFAVKFGITSFDKKQIVHKTDSTFLYTPTGKNQLIFIENHDTKRFASEVNGELSKLKIGAGFNLLLKGIPAIYYGQELGMPGDGGFGKYGSTDANDIPMREAFEWHEKVDGAGMALWYKDSGPWWDETNLKDADGISLEEQRSDKKSLWNFYRTLIALRKTHPALARGDQAFVANNNPQVVSFLRSTEGQKLLVHLNLSDGDQSVEIANNSLGMRGAISFKPLLGEVSTKASAGRTGFTLKPFDIQVLEITDQPKHSILPESFLLYKNFPSKYVEPRNVEVWLPGKYGQLDALPVLYMFDGQNIFHSVEGWGGGLNRGWRVDEVLDSLNEAGSVPEMIVVGIFNNQEKRGAEYMPAKPKELLQQRIAATTHEWYKSFQTTPPESDEQLKFIVEELKPFIDANFKTKKDRANTFVAGSSMGGLISAYAICEYPDVFGGAACFSTHWPPLDGVFLEYIKNNLPDPATHKIYFDHGTEGLDGEYEPFQKIADQAMEARGFEKGKNWMTLKYEGAKHYEDDWYARFHIPVTFLLNN